MPPVLSLGGVNQSKSSIQTNSGGTFTNHYGASVNRIITINNYYCNCNSDDCQDQSHKDQNKSALVSSKVVVDSTSALATETFQAEDSSVVSTARRATTSTCRLYNKDRASVDSQASAKHREQSSTDKPTPSKSSRAGDSLKQEKKPSQRPSSPQPKSEPIQYIDAPAPLVSFPGLSHDTPTGDIKAHLQATYPPIPFGASLQAPWQAVQSPVFSGSAPWFAPYPPVARSSYSRGSYVYDPSEILHDIAVPFPGGVIFPGFGQHPFYEGPQVWPMNLDNAGAVPAIAVQLPPRSILRSEPTLPTPSSAQKESTTPRPARRHVSFSNDTKKGDTADQKATKVPGKRTAELCRAMGRLTHTPESADGRGRYRARGARARCRQREHGDSLQPSLAFIKIDHQSHQTNTLP